VLAGSRRQKYPDHDPTTAPKEHGKPSAYELLEVISKDDYGNSLLARDNRRARYLQAVITLDEDTMRETMRVA
jgi:hypothetical protein